MARMEISNGPVDLRARFAWRRAGSSVLEIDSWIPSEIKAISPLVDRLMRLIEGTHCVAGEEPAVQLALREALNNAVVHGNGMGARKLVHVRCRCELGKGLSLIVTDQGKGFDPNAIADSVASRSVLAEHGRGLHLIRTVMDEVSFAGGGTEVRMQKKLTRSPGTELRGSTQNP